MKKGYTLTELLIAIVIMGILAGIAIPGYQKSVEKANAKQAIAYLRLISTGEKLYYAKNADQYIACTTAALINTNLGVLVSEENYTFTVTATQKTATAPSTFLATATAKSKANSTTITLNQAGTFGGTSPYKPAS